MEHNTNDNINYRNTHTCDITTTLASSSSTTNTNTQQYQCHRTHQKQQHQQQATNNTINNTTYQCVQLNFFVKFLVCSNVCVVNYALSVVHQNHNFFLFFETIIGLVISFTFMWLRRNQNCCNFNFVCVSHPRFGVKPIFVC
eukprot:c26955_g1_i1.p1 GENE.c26955_g1_i1~~c26955_g1_i1.p1  ORF type:complete len:142 (-),score=21.72 c26955_g1_i1:68-493(-)